MCIRDRDHPDWTFTDDYRDADVAILLLKPTSGSSVSYTHLDVYKRQEQYTAKRRPTFAALLARQLPLPFLKGVERHYLMLDEDLSIPREIDFCTGCFFVIRTDVFRRMGGFDESYFMYVEDADITREAQKYGKVFYVPVTYVHHAWHRDPNKKLSSFTMQILSLIHIYGSRASSR